MSRMGRIVLPGFPHHVTQRGHRGEEVFLSALHYQRYLVWLGEASRRYRLRIWAYCLMANHVHLVVVPSDEKCLANAIRVVHTKHAQATNEERARNGHLWHGRYFSCALDDRHLWEAVRYVERNPVRAGLAARAETYPWSSAAAHCGLRPDPVLSRDLPLRTKVDDWAAWLEIVEDERLLGSLRAHTLTGSPCGDAGFRERVAQLAHPPGKGKGT